MATPAQIANDLEEHGKALKGRGMDMLCRSLMRGADTIRQLMDQVTVKETEVSQQRIRSSTLVREIADLARKQKPEGEELLKRAVGILVVEGCVCAELLQRELGVDADTASNLIQEMHFRQISTLIRSYGKVMPLGAMHKAEATA